MSTDPRPVGNHCAFGSGLARASEMGPKDPRVLPYRLRVLAQLGQHAGVVWLKVCLQHLD